MRPVLRILVAVFGGWLLLFILAKILFMLYYHSLYSGKSFGEYIGVLIHGLRLDMATSGYLTALPALFLIAVPWIRSPRAVSLCLKIYLGVMVPVVMMILLVDTGLYGYWDFKLDITPLYYMMTAPGAAMASVSVMMIIGGVIAWAGLSVAAWFGFIKLMGLKQFHSVERFKMGLSGIMLLLAAVLFIPIRGGFGVATINLSAAFFSNDMRLNHAAVNPAFSLLYSAMHQKNFGEMFRFMPPGEASAIMTRIGDVHVYEHADTLINTSRPDVYIIILESFSAHLLPSLGGEPVAEGLDSIAAEGLLFSNAYATSFRTDRAIPAILNGFPSQPTTSLMKYPEKTRHIPSLARSLKDAGYENHYYYGGDPAFANKKTYLLNTGFTDITDMSDFPVDYRRAKWGVPDDKLFDRALDDILARKDTTPDFNVIQTLSSHEPFDVPYDDPVYADTPALNAFRYTDICLSRFINALRQSPKWDNSLIVITPDHYGCYPRISDPMDIKARHHVPVIMTGGALALRGVVDAPVSQVDIVATLLDAMQIDRSAFSFSRNMLNPGITHLAYCSTPSYVALVDTTGVASVYNVENSAFQTTDGTTPADSVLQAYVQTLYDNLQSL